MVLSLCSWFPSTTPIACQSQLRHGISLHNVCLSPFTAIVLVSCTVIAVVGDSLLTRGVGIVGVPMLKVSTARVVL